MIRIEPLSMEDVRETAALPPGEWQDISPVLTAYITNRNCRPMKVVDSGRIIGTGTCIYHSNSAWLAHIIVQTEEQGRGVGRRLTEALVRQVDRKQYPHLSLIATDAGAPLYTKLGFEVEMEYFACQVDPKEIDMNSPSDLEDYDGSWEHQVYELDKAISGEGRRAMLQEYLDGGKLVTKAGALLGAYFPNLGDGLILADDVDAGKALMLYRMHEKENASFPVANAEAEQWMQSVNPKPLKRIRRMTLGKPVEWKPEGLFNRIGGHLG